VLLDFGELKQYLSEIVSGLDHSFLNESGKFAGINPSSENIARYIAEALQAKLSGSNCRVTRITAWESEDACASFIPPGGSV
jgi:6-pyruvoyltetrahydropterin/6-carboxytetrahydropterin synthase